MRLAEIGQHVREGSLDMCRANRLAWHRNGTAAQSLMTVLSEWIEYCGTGASTSHETARSLVSRPHGHSRSAYVAIGDAPNYVYDIKKGTHLLPSMNINIAWLPATAHCLNGKRFGRTMRPTAGERLLTVMPCDEPPGAVNCLGLESLYGVSGP